MEADPDRFVQDPRYPTPGVYFERALPRGEAAFQTGQPAFLGLANRTASQHFQPYWLTRWEQLTESLGQPGEGFVGDAVRGFFENGGKRCVVMLFPVDATSPQGSDAWGVSMRKCLERLERTEGVDLVCAPDLPPEEPYRIELQRLVLEHCKTMGDRFAILEPVQHASVEQAVRNWQALTAVTDGALYYPWLRVTSTAATRSVPPCGHVAGVYARTDNRIGVHKAPANEVVDGVADLSVRVADHEHRVLNAAGVNCLRAFPGRGIRVWGARTLSGRAEWRYVNVRRLFLSLKRWIAETSQDLVFESNGPELWNRIRDELNGYCYGLFRSGALKGVTPEEAYFVKCDDETNLRADRDSGMVITQIGLAPLKPAEFVVVRVTQSLAGVTMG